jgi:hypothetical protein
MSKKATIKEKSSIPPPKGDFLKTHLMGATKGSVIAAKKDGIKPSLRMGSQDKIALANKAIFKPQLNVSIAHAMAELTFIKFLRSQSLH